LSPKALPAARRAAHDAAHRTVRWGAGKLGYEILWPSYYNGIPRFEELNAEFWDRRAAMPGVELDPDRALGYLRDELAPQLAEFASPQAGPAARPGGYDISNDSFGTTDGAVTWAMIRKHRPERVLELGAGSSTLLIRDALAANGQGHQIVVDPFPRDHELGDGDFDLRRISAGDLTAADFEALAADDILFVDTTHTVKVGSEVNHVILEGLPRLAPGVLVHFHDVYLPFEYPRDQVEGLGYHWAEQYLLQAFLAFNDDFEVLIPLHLLVREHSQDLEGILPLPPTGAGSIWLRRR
jgi:hypothetical protein